MNDAEIYQAMAVICAKQDNTFYMKTHFRDGVEYHIFNYYLAAYSDFLQPHALDMRGIMFRINEGNPVLVSVPVRKFFNYQENPFTMNVDFSKVSVIMEKLDGSIINTYLHKGVLALKSKTSLDSDQAIAAEKFISKHNAFKEFVEEYVHYGYTFSMEYTAPFNRVVLYYPNESLRVFSMRKGLDYELTFEEMYNLFDSKGLMSYLVNTMKCANPSNFCYKIKEMEDVEGFVVQLENGQRIKFKTDWYMNLHALKSSFDTPKKLFAIVINEQQDDLYSMFNDNADVKASIQQMEAICVRIYQDYVKNVDKFYEQHKHLSRKEFAILAQKELKFMHFHQVMAVYSNKNIEFKEWAIKYVDEFDEIKALKGIQVDE